MGRPTRVGPESETCSPSDIFAIPRDLYGNNRMFPQADRCRGKRFGTTRKVVLGGMQNKVCLHFEKEDYSL